MGVKSRLLKRLHKYSQWCYVKKYLLILIVCTGASFLSVYIVSDILSARRMREQNPEAALIKKILDETNLENPRLKPSANRIKEYLKRQQQKERKELNKILNLDPETPAYQFSRFIKN